MYYRARTPSKTGGSVVNLFKAIYSYVEKTSLDDLLPDTLFDFFSVVLKFLYGCLIRTVRNLIM